MLTSSSLILSHVPAHNRLTSFSDVFCRVWFQTSGCYSGKTGHAFDCKFEVFAYEHKVWVVGKFDPNLHISGMENEIPLKPLKHFEMSLLHTPESKHCFQYIFRLPRIWGMPLFCADFDTPIGPNPINDFLEGDSLQLAFCTHKRGK